MCKKVSYCNPRIDPCLKNKIVRINGEKIYKTLSSCCGHNKYPESIVVKNLKEGTILELNSKIILGVRKRNRYYTKDQEGYYYIKELK